MLFLAATIAPIVKDIGQCVRASAPVADHSYSCAALN